MLTSTSRAWRTEPNVVNSSTKIRPMTTGTTTESRAAARCWKQVRLQRRRPAGNHNDVLPAGVVEERHLSALAPLGTLSTLSVHRKFRIDPSQPGLRTLAAAVGRALLECADVVREIRDLRPVQR
jgi:hypothetical protein